MKEEESHKLFFSADESPVPLPSVEEAWSAMRKKLDEEKPERGLFFIWRWMGLLLALLLLSFGIFWFVERQGPASHREPGRMVVVPKGGEEGRIGKEENTKKENRSEPQGAGKEENGADHQQEGAETNKKERPAGSDHPQEEIRVEEQKEKADNGERGRTGHMRTGKEENAQHEPEEKATGGQKKIAVTIPQKDITANGQEGESAHHQQKGRAVDDRQQGEGKDRRTSKGGKTIVDADIARFSRDPIQVWVNIPRKAGKIPRWMTDKENKNAKENDKKKKNIPGDSTRILWAAGLQDSKNFPVGSQQPVSLNANLKKDLWLDYVPAPYFQYFISRKIGFQVAVQFNNPQYTESVSIYRKNGDTTGLITNDTDIVVRKLYYLSIPLTVYYSPFRNFYLGAGLQYSNLSNGVAFQNNLIHHFGSGVVQPDTVTSVKVVSLKEYRPAYSNLKRTDWRALFEMNYYWKRLSLGVQYQQGLSDYLYTPVNGSTGKDKNSSFNVYLRYNLWERRIRN